MTVVVTGATGHVGANLIRALRERDREVRVVIHEEDIGLEGLEVERVSGNVLEPDSIRAAFEGAEVVYHLAAIISIVGEMGGRVQATNVGGAKNVAEAALACGVRRLVHFCSIHAFDQSPLDERLDESRPRAAKRRHLAYDRSKAAGEAAVREVVARGLDAVIVHPTAIIGPYDFRPSRVGQVFLDLYHRRLPSLLDGGFDWVDVRDVVAGALAAEERGRTGESYLLGGHYLSIRELAEVAAGVSGIPPPKLTSPMWLARVGAPFVEIFSRLTGSEPLFTRESLAALRANRHIVSTKAQDELGYETRPIEESVRDIYAWFDGAGKLDPPLTPGRA